MSAQRARSGRPAAAVPAATVRDVDLFALFPRDESARSLVMLVKVLARGRTRVAIHDRTLWEALGWSEAKLRRVKRRVAIVWRDREGRPLIERRRSRSHGGLIACSWTVDRRLIGELAREPADAKPALRVIDGGAEADAVPAEPPASSSAEEPASLVSPMTPPGITGDTTLCSSKTFTSSGDRATARGEVNAVTETGGTRDREATELEAAAPRSSEREASPGPPTDCTAPPATAGELERSEPAPSGELAGAEWDAETLELLEELRAELGAELERRGDAGEALAVAVSRLEGRHGWRPALELLVLQAAGELEEHPDAVARLLAGYRQHRRRHK